MIQDAFPFFQDPSTKQGTPSARCGALVGRPEGARLPGPGRAGRPGSAAGESAGCSMLAGAAESASVDSADRAVCAAL